MPELEPQSQSPDPIDSLYRMSTTAGVGQQDYVAINNAAIVTAVLGAATALAFVALPLVFIAAACIVCGVVSLRQIGRSNGTQGGKGLVVAGMLLALVLAGIVGARHVAQRTTEKRHERAVTAILEQFAGHLVAAEYDMAYALFDPEFQRRISAEQFAEVWKQRAKYFGALSQVRGTGLFQSGTAGGRPVVTTGGIFQSGVEHRYPIAFRQNDSGQWLILYIADVFDPPKAS